jgi:hypothetical protein
VIDDSPLVPALQSWNEGRGADLIDYLYSAARSDTAVAYAALLWPRIVRFEGYVLRAEFSEAHLRGWEGQGMSREQVESAVNFLPIGDMFMTEDHTPLLERRLRFLGETLASTHNAKLQRDFSELHFEVRVVDDGDDYGITFFQV